MKLTCLTRADELERIAPAWDELAAVRPLQSGAWLGSWWRHYGAAQANHAVAPCGLCVLAVEDAEGHLAGLAPWYWERGPRGQRVLRFLGSGQVCTDYQTVLCRPGAENPVLEAVVEALTAEPNRVQWNQLDLSGVDAQDATMQQLCARFARRGILLASQPGPATWRIALPTDWEDYLGELSKSHRKQIRRCHKEWFGTGRARLHVVQNHRQLAAAWPILVDLHQRRRHSLGEPGLFADEPFARFLADASPRLLARGQLRLTWLELDGQPAAAEYHLCGGGVVYAYQSGVNPDLLEEQPGRLAMIGLVKLALEQGLTAFDLLRGDEPYKPHWRAEPRASLRIRVWPRGAAGYVRRGAWRAGENVKNWLKRGCHA